MWLDFATSCPVKKNPQEMCLPADSKVKIERLELEVADLYEAFRFSSYLLQGSVRHWLTLNRREAFGSSIVERISRLA